jgi:16S rRNA C1402 (ribose-2'-O) methylase RsmI
LTYNSCVQIHYVSDTFYCLNFLQFWRGTLEQAQKEFEERNPRGEMTLVIEGLSESAANELPSEEDVKLELRTLLTLVLVHLRYYFNM